MNSLNIIFPVDSSTQFLANIPTKLIESFGSERVIIKYIEASEKSYSDGVEFIKGSPDGSHFLFMGHGQDDKLFGGEADGFEKKSLISRSDMSVFKGKYLFSLSCYSCELLRTSLGHSGILNSIGFGSLPTEMAEIKNNKRFTSQGINEAIVEDFKLTITQIVSEAYLHYLKNELQFSDLSNYLMLLLNQMISEVILRDSMNVDNRILSDLLFQMKNEIIYL